MRENTPPASPFHNEDEELVYVDDTGGEIIQLEEIGDNEGEDFDDEDGKFWIWHLLTDESCGLFLDEDMDDDGDVQPERDDSILTFTKHTNSLFCGSFSHCGTFAVTGNLYW